MDIKDMLSVLNNLMQQAYFHCEWGIEWQEKSSQIELIFQFDLDNPQGELYTDYDQVELNSDRIPYEFRVLFYDASVFSLTDSKHLHIIPVDYDEGIYYGELVSIIKYLKILTSSVRLQWLEFQKGSQSLFQIHWDECAYHQVRQSIIDARRYSETRVLFPRTNKQI